MQNARRKVGRVQTVEVDKIKVIERPIPNKEQQAALLASIKDVGLIHPITVTRNMVLIDGYARLCAAKDAGFKTIEVIVER